ncbi:copper homeostasis periplasmic binding protein CopC [Pseudomonas sp. dw_358]|uniref:copper homeostasis periplasmic binding protein CopC n=1 Tax=Pseudomonas sp. dw_358 TaxID=2720083 RepID=UPI001BD41C98|nr:copper homeostasis periplasmic binding protein CopC [Pseudomonas sp. dw_358]
MTAKRLLSATALLASAIASNGVWAHAHLKTQTPAADSTVAAPAQLRLEFSEGVEAGFSQVTLTPSSGTALPLKPLATAEGDKKVLLVTPDQPLSAGDYTVNWQVISVDTHKSAGSYHFKVGQ